MNIYKKKANQFISQFNITQITSESLINAIEKCGYKVIRFRPYVNKDNVHDLMEKLDILEFASGEKAFTYIDANNRFVFLSKDLSEEECCILLSHEAGHVYLKHIGSKLVLGQDIISEYEANEFSHYLLNNDLPRKIRTAIKKNKTAYLIAAIASAVLICSVLISVNVFLPGNNSLYYVSESGEKYHRKSCIYIKGKNNLKQYTLSELKQMDYSHCKVCIPDG